MPLPKPKPVESKKAFVDRCMGNPIMVQEFPENTQRLAVCNRQAKLKRKETAMAKKSTKKTCGDGIIHLESQVEFLAESAPTGQKTKGPPRFRTVAYTGGAVRPFWPGHGDRPVVIDLEGLQPSEPVPVLFNHSRFELLGQSTHISMTETELHIEGAITGDANNDDSVRQLLTHARNGFKWRASPGINPTKIETVEVGSQTEVNGATFDGPLYVIRESTLEEVSFLAIAADKNSRVDIAATAALSSGDSDMEFAKWLSDLGFASEDDLEEAQRVKLRAKYDAEVKSASVKGAEPASPKSNGKRKASAHSDILAIEKANRERRLGIQAVMKEFGGDYPDAIEMIEAEGAKAMEDEAFTPRDFENLMFRECTRSLRIDNRPQPSKGKDSPIPEEEFTAALCRSSGMSRASLEKNFQPRTLESAERRWRYGLSLREFLEITAKAHGYHGDFRSNPQEVLTHALPPPHVRMAGPSTYDVSGITGGVLNRMVVDYFSSVDMAAMNRIAATRPTRDFREVESYALTSDLQFQRIAPGGEITHGTFGEEKYTNRAYTYGRMITIDRTTLINDDIGALNSIARHVGRGGALALVNEFWKIFINNSTFFTAARGNFDDGADSVLDLDGLTSAKVLFNKLTDPGGKPMNVSPRILLVPPELEATARTILNSTLIVIAGNTDQTVGNANIHAGTLDLAMARELSSTAYTGNSTKKWYILAEPRDVPVTEIAYLNGVDRPTIENAQADFNILGISLRGYFDFGVAMQEFRGGVAMKGEA